MKLAEMFLDMVEVSLLENKEVEDFLQKFKAHYEKIANKDNKSPDLDMTINWKKGNKYYSVFTHYKSSPDRRSQYMFVDHEGNIYKAAGWGKPAKGIRSNIKTLDLTKVDPYTSWLYK
jgi:hypothetical protein